MYLAVAGRKLANLRYLVDAGCPLHPHACITASKNGDVDCLMYLHECGLELYVSCAVGAASHGHLSCLIYLHQQGCPWEERCCEKAAFGGHLNCLKFCMRMAVPGTTLHVQRMPFWVDPGSIRGISFATAVTCGFL